MVRTRGISLVEVMVSTALLGVCSAGLLSAINHCSNRESYLRRRAVIFERIRQEIDNARSLAAKSQLPVSANTTFNTTFGTATLTTTSTTSSTDPTLYQVTVSITWPESFKRNDSMSYSIVLRQGDA